MKINQVCWDPEIRLLYVKFPTIALKIYFRRTILKRFGNKWLSWRLVSSIYENKNLDQMIGKSLKPPIRNIPRFIERLIMNFKMIYDEADIWEINVDKGTCEWIKKKRKT